MLYCVCGSLMFYSVCPLTWSPVCFGPSTDPPIGRVRYSGDRPPDLK